MQRNTEQRLAEHCELGLRQCFLEHSQHQSYSIYMYMYVTLEVVLAGILVFSKTNLAQSVVVMLNVSDLMQVYICSID